MSRNWTEDDYYTDIDRFRDGFDDNLQEEKQQRTDQELLDPPCRDCQSIPCACPPEKKARVRAKFHREMEALGFKRTVWKREK